MQEWFTPQRRKAIYQVSVALGGVLIAFGVLTTDKWSAIFGLLLALTNLLASNNVNLLD